MGQQIVGGISGVAANVDGSTFGALNVRNCPLDVGALGHYRIALQSGLLVNTGIAANSPLFSLRWADSTRLCVVTRLRARLIPVTIFTAAQELGMALLIARSFTVADSAGTTSLPSSGSNKMRTSMGSNLLNGSSGDLRIAATTLLTAGTRTLDDFPIASTSGYSQNANPAAGTQFVEEVVPEVLLETCVERGEHPIVLAQNEGLVLNNLIAFASNSGVCRLAVEMTWAETAAY